MVVVYVRFPLSLRNLEDLAFERGIDNCHETERFWLHPFGPMFADWKPDQSRAHFRK
jgi:putative transposase